ncbi:MAG: hypothetical protein ACR2PW_07540 [Gammaproteobacteria bacterium]
MEWVWIKQLGGGVKAKVAIRVRIEDDWFLIEGGFIDEERTAKI